MKKITVSYNYEVNKFIEIDVDDLLDIDGISVEEIVKKYILKDTYNFTDIGFDDVLLYQRKDEDFIYFEVVDTIEENEDGEEYVDNLTIEELQLLNNSKKYNI